LNHFDASLGAILFRREMRSRGKNLENAGIRLTRLYLYWRAATRRPGLADESTPGPTLQEVPP